MKEAGRTTHRISPFLWFDDKAEGAARFYTSIFANSSIEGVPRYGEGDPGPKGTVTTVAFQLAGQNFTALNGGLLFTFSPAAAVVSRTSAAPQP